MKKRFSRMGLNALLLGIVLGAVVGLVAWLLTERPVTSILIGLVPPLVLLCLVRDTIWEDYPDDDMPPLD